MLLKSISMHKTEVQSLVPFSSRSLKIVGFLFRRQLCPLPFFALVTPDVVLLHGDVQYNVEHGDGHQGTISFSVSKVRQPVSICFENFGWLAYYSQVYHPDDKCYC